MNCSSISRMERSWLGERSCGVSLRRNRIWQIVLKRDHINYRKNDRWCSYRFYRALQRLKSPMRYIWEIFGAPQFSGFSTQSARSRLLPFDHLIGAGEFIQAGNTGLQPPRGQAAIPLNVSTPENLALLRHGLER